MKVKVLFFGATADAAGTRSKEIEVTNLSTAREAFDRVVREHPELSAHELRLALNEQYATGDEVLKDGDELAVFTPVSGG